MAAAILRCGAGTQAAREALGRRWRRKVQLLSAAPAACRTRGVPSSGLSSAAALLWCRTLTDVASEADFARATDAKGPPTLTFYTAAWCEPCQEIAAHIEELSSQLEGPHLRMVRVDVECLPSLVRSQGVKAVPHFEVHRAGHVVERLAGCGPEAVREVAERHASDFAEMLKKRR